MGMANAGVGGGWGRGCWSALDSLQTTSQLKESLIQALIIILKSWNFQREMDRRKEKKKKNQNKLMCNDY